jgi:general stress protein YciG
MLSKERGRGFASMDRDRQRNIASKGGKAAHSSGKAHEFTAEQAREAGRKGGISVSRDKSHMAAIGRKGGFAVSSDRAHMARIGRKGGAAVSEDRGHMAEIGREGGHVVSEDREHMAEIGREGARQKQGEANPTPNPGAPEAPAQH